MRIAVDARPLAAPLTGIGRYTHSLLKRLTQTDHEWFLYSDRPLTTELPPSKNLTIRTGHASGGSPGSLRWAQLEYIRWAKKDHIQVFWSPRHHLPLLLPHRIRTIVTVHDLVWKQFPETMQRKNLWLERLLMGPSIRKAGHIICVSEFTRTEISSFYPSVVGKCEVIYEAAEIAKQNSGDQEKPITTPYLLFVGTLEPRKNLVRLLEAYASIKGKGLPHLVIAGGSGWGGIQLESLIRRLGLDDCTTLLGYVSDRTLQGLYEHATCLLMPSLYEGFGLPALEAMNHGVPVLFSKGTSLDEVVGEGGVGVNPESLEEIAGAIITVNREFERSKMSAAAHEQARKFSWELAARQTLAVLTET